MIVFLRIVSTNKLYFSKKYSRVFDPCLRFLDFDTKEIYKFLSVRFDCASSPVQEQALYWLQVR